MTGFRIGVLCAVLSGAPAGAQDVVAGAQLYQRHCASCHGFDGTGGGPLAPSLVLQPTDLSQLQQANDGVFPLVRVIWRIDGREPLVSHGSPMPIFGEFFEGRDMAMKTEAGQPVLTSQPIIDLVGWLQAIQR